MLNKGKIMYKYKVQVKKVSGRLNESVLPSKNLIVKTKTKKSKSAVLTEASKFFKKKYGLVIESAEVQPQDEYFYSEVGVRGKCFYKVLKKTPGTVTVVRVKTESAYDENGNKIGVQPSTEVAKGSTPVRKKVHNLDKNKDPKHDYIEFNLYGRAVRWMGVDYYKSDWEDSFKYPQTID